jgi:hypothetical protein
LKEREKLEKIKLIEELKRKTLEEERISKELEDLKKKTIAYETQAKKLKELEDLLESNAKSLSKLEHDHQVCNNYRKYYLFSM